MFLWVYGVPFGGQSYQQTTILNLSQINTLDEWSYNNPQHTTSKPNLTVHLKRLFNIEMCYSPRACKGWLQHTQINKCDILYQQNE
jgi:hypothetical protein